MTPSINSGLLRTTDWVRVGQFASVEVSLPVVTIGSGQPCLTLLSCLHGNETASLFVMKELLRLIEGDSEIRMQGSIKLVMCANMPAVLTSNRLSPLDDLDMNRIGLGDANGTLTERLAAAIFNEIRASDMVIDLHEFSMASPVVAIYIPSNSDRIDERVTHGITAFAPDAVWAIDPHIKKEVEYGESFIAALCSAGIPSFALETSQLSFLAREDVLDVANRLLRVAALLEIIPGGSGKQAVAPVYRRTVIRSESSGIWEPRAGLLEGVGVNSVIGQITSLDLSKSTQVVASIPGVTLQVANRQLVHSGCQLFAIGAADKSTYNFFLQTLTAKFN